MRDNIKAFKPIFKKALKAIDSAVVEGLRNPFPVDPDSYPKSIRKIHDALIENAAQREASPDSGHLAKVSRPFDYYLPKFGCIVELDERQHFTNARAISLNLYPKKAQFGFDVAEWIDLCLQIQATDKDPLWRDEQRAWLDSLRDLAWRGGDFNNLLEIKFIIRIFERHVIGFSENPKKLSTCIKKYLGRFQIENSKRL